MHPTDDSLALWLARQARRLGLDTARSQEADTEALQSFAVAVLEELAARGLVSAEPELDCWSRPRSGAN
ncbi:hypothetical protein QOL99_12260 [Deinococcus sp. MIMF12]|uniref:Uncharacterized protein n=1 Tax=Deinococcus rhizophilus TaxID=3049544 RepID=A0ABT7JLV2_9DEIO|nr:hypothetical protein [Deinococcus rhizophilus]